MKIRTLGRIAAVAVTATLGLTLTACGSSSNPLAAPSGSGIVVGSAGFGESKILAEIYAGALNAKGIKASTHLGIGARDAYLKALDEGSIAVVPDYSGNLLEFYQPKSRATTSADVIAALKKALPSNLEVLNPSTAEDKDSLNVTAAFASKHGLTSIADLRKVPNLSLASSPEFKTNAYGLPGLASVYGITGIAFTAIGDYGGPATVKALTSGQVDVADIYTTTPAISQNHLVTLTDPKNLIAAQNVLPVIRKDKDSAKITEILNEVSAKLTTAALVQLNAEYDGPNKPSPAAVAAQWLKANGFS